jgi:hypothetical protein
MDSFLLRVRIPTLLLATFLPALPALAADRALDLSSGCKLYRLENKAWKPTDGSAKNGAVIPDSGVVKDAAFFVFRDAGGTYGVNRKCVVPANGSPAESQSAAPAAPAAKPRPTAKRTSAARPAAASAMSRREPWSVAFGFGMNLGPKGTQELSGATTGSTETKFKSTLAFLGEAAYRMGSSFRIGAEIGLSQLADEDGSGNETSHFAFRPELVFPVGDTTEVYLGPMVGLFFLSQNAETQTGGVTTFTLKQQTASSVLLGGRLGADFMLSDQFDLGAFLAYFKPGPLTVKAEASGGVSGAVEAKLSATWILLGARFVIHF